jgi:DNA repair exonuclease SbcCD ATPase subunit
VTGILRRIEITGGFLHDLDIEFVPGLNVIIGPRGAGKTSVLELLRYAFGVKAITHDADDRARRHALDVLVDGSVLVTVAQGDDEVSASRDAHSDADAAPSAPLSLRPLIVSQREIEDIGLDARSRLHILDGLVDADDGANEHHLLQQVSAAAAAIDRLLETADRQRTRLLERADVPQQLTAAEQEAAAQGATSAQIETAQARLRELSARLDEFSMAAAATQGVLEAVGAVRDRIADAETHATDLAGPDEDSPARVHVTRGTRLLGESHAEMLTAVRMLERQNSDQASKVLVVRRDLRVQSMQLEELKAGAGDLARRLTHLRERDTERRQIEERLADLDAEIADAQGERDRLLDQLDEFRERRFERRKRGAAIVADLFNGEIEVRLAKNGLSRDYEAALATALEGSNLQYKALARQLTARLSPRELVEAVERHDAAQIAKLGQITPDRAERLVAHLRANGSAPVLTAPLEDAVDYALLDGQAYKPTAELSTGQRCTVILPLLLAQSAQLTILDQPEDHLDNAFIVDTLVQAVLARKTGGQLIIATHNANIPVLGEADQVIVLSSDGRHGGVEHIGALDDLAIVRSVTAIMEGGEQAFRRRAEFYAEHR